MQNGEFFVLGGDGLEQFLLCLLAVEVIASPGVDEHVEDGLLLV
jgi:hypothetical protein